MPDAPYIHLVDDDEAIRHSASFMLRHAGYRVKTYEDGVTFLKSADGLEQGCILLDVRMPIMDGLEVLDQLGQRGVDVPVIILTGHGDVSVAVEAMKKGAIDFIEKPYEKHTLITAIKGGLERTEDKAGQARREDSAKARLNILTPRETDVLECLVDGMTNKAIAETYAISARTVEIHRANLMEKLEADSLSAVLKVAFAAGIGISDD